METRTVEVDAEQTGARLDRWLADALGISRARVRHLLDAGRVRLADHALALADKSRAVASGDRYSVEGALHAEEERPERRADLPLEIAATGEGWLIVDKPPGSGVHPLHPEQRDTLLNAVVARSPEIVGVGEGGLRSGVVHRLDVETSGALVFATEEEAWKRWRGAFSAHRVDKRYRVIVAGRFPRERRVDLALEITRHSPAHVEVRPGGRTCRQHVRPLRDLEGATVVEVKLETGFLHQIRASLAHLGHPLLGDAEYGGPMEIGGVAIPRVMLHAARIAWQDVDVEVAPPADFLSVQEALAAATV